MVAVQMTVEEYLEMKSRQDVKEVPTLLSFTFANFFASGHPERPSFHLLLFRL